MGQYALSIWTRSVARPNDQDSSFPYPHAVGRVRKLAGGERKERKKKKKM